MYLYMYLYVHIYMYIYVCIFDYLYTYYTYLYTPPSGLLSQAYDLSSKLILKFAEVDITVGFLMQVIYVYVLCIHVLYLYIYEHPIKIAIVRY
jgi:hypothetical protein